MEYKTDIGIQPALDDGTAVNGTSDADIIANKPSFILPITRISQPNVVYAMAYGGNQGLSNVNDVEQRLQRLERGQKFVRRGRVVVTLPSFKTQSFISQTSANNPFTAHTISGASFPSGLVPDSVAPA